MKKTVIFVAVLLVGAAIGALITLTALPQLRSLLNLSAEPQATGEQPKKKEPLYWVAPMDPNYQRDKPGKSPMGMDLVPVYEEDAGGADFRIPAVGGYITTPYLTVNDKKIFR